MDLHCIKKLTTLLLLVNSMEFVFAMDSIREQNNQNDIFVLKQNLQDNINSKLSSINDLQNDKTVKMKAKSKACQENKKNEVNNNAVSSHYKENDMNNLKDKNQNNTQNDNDEIDNIFENWTYNDSVNNDDHSNSAVKTKYKELEDNLIKRSSTQYNAPLVIPVEPQNVRKLSDASKASVKSHFSNPLNISHKNVSKKIDELLNSHEEIIPIITLQSDGLQVLDTIAHLIAFNSFFNLSNFSTNPYIYCVSSASIPGLSLALDLQKLQDPCENLKKIGSKLCETAKQKSTSCILKKKCFNCSCSAFELLWLSLFGCCIDYDAENILDSLYTKIPNKTANNIITNILDLPRNSDIELPNLVIKGAKSDIKVIDQVLQSNNNQDTKSNKNQIKLFAEPFVSFIKHFVDCKKETVQKGINFVANNINTHDLIKISSRDEEDFIQQKNLNDSTVDRLAIILSSDVDNNSEIQQDTNNVEIEYKEIKDDEESQDKLHAIKINLYTANSILNPNYSLEEKINNVKLILDNSREFKYLVKNLPQMNSSCDSSSESSIDLQIQNTLVEK